MPSVRLHKLLLLTLLPRSCLRCSHAGHALCLPASARPYSPGLRKNRKFLGTAFRDVKGELFPTLGLHSFQEK